MAFQLQKPYGKEDHRPGRRSPWEGRGGNTLPRFLLSALISSLLLAGSAQAVPVIAGFGDSLTSLTHDDGSYLSLLNNYIDPDATMLDFGITANPSSTVATRLVNWVSGFNTADLVIILTGTPDVFDVRGVPYDENSVVGNVTTMMNALIGAGIPALVLAPPPVIAPCDGAMTLPVCPDDYNTRLDSLSVAIGNAAASLGVPFVDLFELFSNQPDLTPLYIPMDGVHLTLNGGDQLIVSAIGSVVQSLLVPEPDLMLLTALGLAALAARRRLAARS